MFLVLYVSRRSPHGRQRMVYYVFPPHSCSLAATASEGARHRRSVLVAVGSCEIRDYVMDAVLTRGLDVGPIC